MLGGVDAEADRLAIRVPRDIREAGECLDDVAVALEVGVGATASKGTDRDVERVREALAHRVYVVERELRGRLPGGHQHVGARDQLGGDGGAALAVHVERDAALAAVEEGVPAAAVEVRLIAGEGTGAADHIALGRLDADHLGADLREQLARVGDGEPRRDLDDAHALEGARRVRCHPPLPSPLPAGCAASTLAGRASMAARSRCYSLPWNSGISSPISRMLRVTSSWRSLPTWWKLIRRSIPTSS